jgi:hypothetical protein
MTVSSEPQSSPSASAADAIVEVSGVSRTFGVVHDQAGRAHGPDRPVRLG